MKTILLYINAINGGGAERVMVNLSTQFAEHGYRVIFTTSYKAEGEYELSPKVKRLSLEDNLIKQSKLMRNITRIIKLRKVIKKEKPDVLITFMPEPNFRGIIATKGFKTKNVISIRNVPEKEYNGNISKFLARYLLPIADGCVFQTKDAKEWFPKKLQDKSRIIPNSVNPIFYDIQRKPDKNLIITCGRLTEQKNQLLLIRAFVNTQKVLKNAKLYIYGEGNLKNKLNELIHENRLEGKVILKGQTSNVAEALSKADLFVLSSDYEGMPNVLMEAMAIGIPCISTDCPCGGPRDLIKNDIDGLLVPVGNEEKMSEAIIKLLSNNKLKEDIGNKAKEKALIFRPEIIFAEWKDYIDSVIEK